MSDELRVPIATASDLWLVSYRHAARYFAGQVTAREERATPGASSARAEVVTIAGPIAKDPWVEMFGGTSSLQTQRRVREAREDKDVRAIFLLVDSPGGEVAGIEELAGEVYAAAQEKPVHAHIDDLGASAALWVASQANTITANATADVGSIGVVAVIPDTADFWAQKGVKFHVVSTGEKKGALVPDAGITEDALADVQSRIDAVHRHFLNAVMRGRQMTPDDLAPMADGRVVDAERALELGLIDGIASRKQAIGQLCQAVASSERRARRRAEALARADRLV